MKYKLKEICYQNRYPQIDAESILGLASDSYEVKLLPSSKNYDLFTSRELAGDRICKGEVTTLGKARYANIKYWNGDFISSNNNIIESKNGELLRGHYLYYFLFHTAKDYYAEATTYPKFDQSSFDNHIIEIPEVSIQDKRLKVLDMLTNIIEKEEFQISQLDELIKSRFIELFENQNFSLRAIGEISSFCSRGKSPNYVENSNLLVINQACIYWDELKIENVKYNEDTYEGDRILMRNDILINSTGTGTLGRCNVFNVDDGNRYMADSHVTILRLLGQINPIYFKYWFKSEKTQSCIYSDCVNGSTNQIELSREKLRKVEIPLPPIELQNEFASFVEKVDKLKFSYYS